MLVHPPQNALDALVHTACSAVRYNRLILIKASDQNILIEYAL